jgi:hypothetical protein
LRETGRIKAEFDAEVEGFRGSEHGDSEEHVVADFGDLQ